MPRDAWPNWVLGNHDQCRIRSRVGLQQARVAAILLLTLRGTPTMYYGDEIGMEDVPIPFSEIKDPQGLNMPHKNLSRDPARTPMQWDGSANSGFTSGNPWLRINKTYARENVAAEKEDAYSMLMLYKRLIGLRQHEPALSVGSYKHVSVSNQGLSYMREAATGDKFLVVLNFTHRPCHFVFKEEYKGCVEVATTPELEKNRIENNIYLSGDEGLVIRLDDNW